MEQLSAPKGDVLGLQGCNWQRHQKTIGRTNLNEQVTIHCEPEVFLHSHPRFLSRQNYVEPLDASVAHLFIWSRCQDTRVPSWDRMHRFQLLCYVSRPEPEDEKKLIAFVCTFDTGHLRAIMPLVEHMVQKGEYKVQFMVPKEAEEKARSTGAEFVDTGSVPHGGTNTWS
jgi:hypothetical protein